MRKEFVPEWQVVSRIVREGKTRIVVGCTTPKPNVFDFVAEVEKEYSARLICAAPDLKESLEKILMLLEYGNTKVSYPGDYGIWKDCVRRAQAAVVKSA